MGQCCSSQPLWDNREGHEGVGPEGSLNNVHQQPSQSPDPLGDYLEKNCIQYNLPVEQYVYQHMSLYKDSIPTDCMIYHHIAMVLPILSRYVSRKLMVNLLRAFPFIKESYGAFLLWIIEWQPLSCNIARNWNFLNELHRLTSREILRDITANIYEKVYDPTPSNLYIPRNWTVETIPLGNTDHAFSLLLKCNESFSNEVSYISTVDLKKIRKLTVNCSSFPRTCERLANKLIRKIKFWFDQICCSSADSVRILAVERCSPILVAMLINMIKAYLKDFNMKMHIQDDRDVIIIRLPNEPKIKFFQRYMLTCDLSRIKGINHLRIQDARQMADRRPIPFPVTFKILQYSQPFVKRISCDVPLYAACGANFTINLPYLTQLSVRVDGPLDIFLPFRSLQILKLTNYENNNLHVQPIIYCSGDDWYTSNIWELMEKLKHLVILRKDPNEPIEYIRKYSKEMFEYRRSRSIDESV